MKYNQFKTFLQEVLDSSQKEKVDSWEKGDNSFSDHIFEGKDERKSFELENPRKSDHQDVVKQHLEPHGFSIKNYKDGTAIDKHGRDTTIGKALNDYKEKNSVFVRSTAVKNPNITKEQLHKALKPSSDENRYVESHALTNPKITKEHLDTAINHPDELIREKVVNHPKVTKEQLQKLASDKNDEVREAAINKLK